MALAIAERPTNPYRFAEEMLLDGAWRRGTSAHRVLDLDPWSGRTLVEFSSASVADVDDAYAAARSAQRRWEQTLPAEPAEVMRAAAQLMLARRDELIDWLVRESGGTRTKSGIEFQVTRTAFLQAEQIPYRMGGEILPSDVPGKEYRIHRRPVGVVTVISPWNFPLYLTSRSVAPALAAGNAVVVKPAENTPVTGGLFLARLLEEAGLPPGVLSVLVGRGSEIGDALVTHRVPRVVSFTGSTAVGEGIARISGIKKLGLELGGNAPMVVLDDADIEQAVEAAVWGSYFNQGQICMIANRLILDSTIYDAFMQRFLARVGELAVGDPSDPATDIGPLVSAEQLASVTEKLERTRAAGGKFLIEGEAIGPSGLALPPHVIEGDASLPSAREEVFGPVITVLRAEHEPDALRLANDTSYGLTSSVFTKDIDRGERFALGIQAGMGHVNDVSVHDEPHVPFGGEKLSGVGRFGGRWILDEVTTEHLVSVQRQARNYKL